MSETHESVKQELTELREAVNILVTAMFFSNFHSIEDMVEMTKEWQDKLRGLGYGQKCH